MAERDQRTLPLSFRAGARVRGVASQAGGVTLLAGVAGALLLPDHLVSDRLALGLGFVGFLLLMLGTILTIVPRGPRLAPRAVAPPVRGRWVAVNSPASGVPSHGTHGHGQTFAIDLVYEPALGTRPAFGSGAAFRPAQDFPGFGQEILAPADGRVVAVRQSAPDHRSRSNRPAGAYMLLEGAVRELGGSRFLLGNYVVLDLGDGAYATLAHLQRGSVAVRPGQLVRQGDVLARCGNSGNSSEPHLHFQLADHQLAFVAAGLPFVFTGVRLEGAEGTVAGDGVPANEQAMVAPSPEFRVPSFELNAVLER
ncbi:MAG TPA: M23 family metallopeptidase [Chloroflexota bacterium]|nr:M23 family metallopeptidase [Chloroflexota bacterium]